MSLSTASYEKRYEEYEGKTDATSFSPWKERIFTPSDPTVEKRIFTPSDTVEKAFRERDKRVDQADKKVEEKWFSTDFFFVTLWPTLLDELENTCDRYRSAKNLWDNDCYLNALKEVIKNHPEKNLASREQELTMWLLKILLLKQYDEVKEQFQDEKVKLRLLGEFIWYDYNQNVSVKPAV